MGLLHAFSLVAILQVLVADALRISMLHGGDVLQAAVPTRPGNTHTHQQLLPGEEGGSRTPTIPWESEAGRTLMMKTDGAYPQDGRHSAATEKTGGAGAGGGVQGETGGVRRVGSKPQSGGRMVATGPVEAAATGTQDRGRSNDARNVTTPNARRRSWSPGTQRVVEAGSSKDRAQTAPGADISPTPVEAEPGEMFTGSQYRPHTRSTTVLPPEDALQPSSHGRVPQDVNVKHLEIDSGVSAGSPTPLPTLNTDTSYQGNDDVSRHPPPASSTRPFYTFPPGLKPNLAYFGFIVYDTTPGFNGAGHNHPNQPRAISEREATAWIITLSIACFLGGILLASIASYAIYKRKWNTWWRHRVAACSPTPETLPNPEREGSPAHTSDQLPLTGTDMELLDCPQGGLPMCDFLSGLLGCKHATHKSFLHRQPPDGSEDDRVNLLPSPSSVGSRSGSSGSSNSTCSTILTLEEPMADAVLDPAGDSPHPWDRPESWSDPSTDSGLSTHGSFDWEDQR